jgi:hypothetical protein
MKRLVAGGVLLGALALGGATAVKAGQKSSYPVSIAMGTNQFIVRGALGSVRNAAGTTGFIGCWSDAAAYDPVAKTGGVPSVACSAQWNGGGIACISTDDALFRVSQLISGDSYIEFHVWNNTANPNDPKNGTCTYLQVQNYSVFEPKVL